MSNFTNTAWVPTDGNTGDNAWQLTAATIIGLQSVPGLVVLYAGIMRTKWAVNSAFMAFYGFAATLIVWVIWAYKMAFGQYMLPFVGRPGPVLKMQELLQQSCLPSTAPDGGLCQNFPLSTMVYFQFVFAAITVVILAGSLLGRMNFMAWMLFVPLWVTFSYTIGAYSIWGGGYLYQLGVIDYSGGYVIHISSGTAGWVAANWIGPRLKADMHDSRPSNMMGVLIGAGFLWGGWNGFNGGDPYSASADAGAAVLNTNIATAMSILTWTMMDVILGASQSKTTRRFHHQPSLMGAVQGMICGLVAITPAAGLVAGWGAIIIGVCSGSIPWLTLNRVSPWITKKVRYFENVDDVLGIFHTHLVAGSVGGFCTGLFATLEGCEAFGIAATSPGGAIEGNGKQVWLQIVGALAIIAWNIVWTSLILLFIKYVVRVPLRMTDEQLLLGDVAIHDEQGYMLCEAHDHDGMRQRAAARGMSMGDAPIEGVEQHHFSGAGTPELKDERK